MSLFKMMISLTCANARQVSDREVLISYRVRYERVCLMIPLRSPILVSLFRIVSGMTIGQLLTVFAERLAYAKYCGPLPSL